MNLRPWRAVLAVALLLLGASLIAGSTPRLPDLGPAWTTARNWIAALPEQPVVDRISQAAGAMAATVGRAVPSDARLPLAGAGLTAAAAVTIVLLRRRRHRPDPFGRIGSEARRGRAVAAIARDHRMSQDAVRVILSRSGSAGKELPVGPAGSVPFAEMLARHTDRS